MHSHHMKTLMWVISHEVLQASIASSQRVSEENKPGLSMLITTHFVQSVDKEAVVCSQNWSSA